MKKNRQKLMNTIMNTNMNTITIMNMKRIKTAVVEVMPLRKVKLKRKVKG